MVKDQKNAEAAISRRDFGRLLAPGTVAATGLFGARARLFAQSTHDTSRNDLGARTYNIRESGAVGDGKTPDTQALQRAIDACHADGGGTVLVPAGTFVIGTVELKSNVTLHLAAAATLLGSPEGSHYHAISQIPLHGDATLEDGNYALLFAVDAKNITIEGKGTIDGHGAQFRSVDGAPPPSGLAGDRRPYHLLFYRCEGITLKDVSLLDSAYHSVRIIQSSHVHIDAVYIHNRVNGNNDGFHFISTEHVTLTNCTVKSQDDACALFGSCRHITIANSFFSTRWSVFRFGGGHAEDIAITNCLLHEVGGCPIKFQGDSAARFENISFSNLIFKDVTGPISISVGGRMNPPNDSTPVIVRNISFSNLRGNVVACPPARLPESALSINSRPGERNSCIVLNSVNGATLENISFDNVHLTFAGGGTSQDASQRDIPQTYGEYFKLGTPPSYALFARNARGLTLHNVRFQVDEPDLRPAIVFDSVQDAAINCLSIQANPRAESVLRLIDSRQILLTATRVLTPASTFLQIEGSSNDGIIVEGGDLSKAASPLAARRGAKEQAVKLRNLS